MEENAWFTWHCTVSNSCTGRSFYCFFVGVKSNIGLLDKRHVLEKEVHVFFQHLLFAEGESLAQSSFFTIFFHLVKHERCEFHGEAGSLFVHNFHSLYDGWLPFANELVILVKLECGKNFEHFFLVFRELHANKYGAVLLNFLFFGSCLCCSLAFFASFATFTAFFATSL